MSGKNGYRAHIERLRQKAQATKTPATGPPAAPEPAPSPETEFSDPGARAELLADQLRDLQAQVARERAAREQAERRASELEADRVAADSHPGFSHGVFSKPRRRASWK